MHMTEKEFRKLQMGQLNVQGPKNRRHKFGAKETYVDGIRFPSEGEARRYLDLKYLEKSGEIRDLRLQPKFVIFDGFTDNAGKKHQPIHYIADFQYWEEGQAMEIVEDFKGKETRIFQMKMKMFLYRYPQYLFRITK